MKFIDNNLCNIYFSLTKKKKKKIIITMSLVNTFYFNTEKIISLKFYFQFTSRPPSSKTITQFFQLFSRPETIPSSNSYQFHWKLNRSLLANMFM